jgi:hypothetical protein
MFRKRRSSGTEFQISLSLKINLIAVVTITIILGVFGLYQYQSVSARMYQNLQQQLENTASRLRISLRKPLFDYDEESLKDSVIAEMKSPVVAGVFISDKGKLLYGFSRNPSEEIVPTRTLLSEKEFLVLDRSIENEGTTIGEVKVFVSLKYLREDLRNMVLSIGIQALSLDILIVVILSIFIRGIFIKPLERVIDGLNESAQQVASAAGQISSASQSLAEGTSEQAASAEETASSLEDISSICRQNADHAKQTDLLEKETNQLINKMNTSVDELTGSMAEISEASKETSRIVKAIDEISFRTNLLALNAAIEAARAGEVGAGFAVVADEVKRLASSAAESAKNTGKLIEKTVNKISDSSALVFAAREDFSKLAANAANVGRLVAEIAAGSREQFIKIEQISMAMTEVTKITQQNASSSEESASASQEMNAQAEQMKEFANALGVMVRGN